MRSSDRTPSSLRSFSISTLILCLTASAEWDAPPSEEAMEEVKKNFSSNTPREVAMYLLEVTRLTVGLVHADGVGHGLQVQGAQVLHPEGQKGVLLANDLAGDLQNGLGALIQALHQPGGGGHAVWPRRSFPDRCARPWTPWRDSADPTSKRGRVVGIQLDPPADQLIFPHVDVRHHRRRRF